MGVLLCKTVQTSPELKCTLALKSDSPTFKQDITSSRYVATVHQVASEFEVSKNVSLSWDVFGTPKHAELAGSYTSAITKPLGSGAVALIGGNHNSITLFPQISGAARTVVSMQLAAR
jgi:hypothetical protein